MYTNLRANSLFNILNALQVVSITGMAGVAQLVELWIVIPLPPSNISDLALKTVRTNADGWSECGRNADQMQTLDLLPSALPTALTYPNKCKQL